MLISREYTYQNHMETAWSCTNLELEMTEKELLYLVLVNRISYLYILIHDYHFSNYRRNNEKNSDLLLPMVGRHLKS